ncbi:AraC family transcriptional regulator [Actinacidiphila acidipaludis]|uniref:Helix-turn-helix domain-containing protein n=1 Tax=Actinacidiphila acidipaludis TaxID=2873382 RepID=A0ABS7Q715_9ACTN|nr:helix-turn-helix domain-containing protein [Streptomyces acidipaludis]MBY8878948.1 helix-turn-helix domain-containing protein [Streptomyces acidipaludis]
MRGTRGRTEDGTWELVTTPPGARLGAGVLRYRGFRLDMNRPQRRIELPSGMITLVVNLRDSVYVGPLDAEAPRPAFTSLVNGPRDSPAVGEHDGRLEGVEIHLAPWMAYSVLHTDMHELRGRMLTLPELLGRAGAELADRLAEARGWAGRFAVVDDVLARRIERGRAAAPQVSWAWQQLTRSDGLVPLGRLAAATGWSARTLEQRFRQQIGLSPKTASRVLRMQRVLRMLTAGAAPSAVAAACGFYDQAHLHRDVRAMTGSSPGEFLARRRRAARPVDRVPGRVTSALLH